MPGLILAQSAESVSIWPSVVSGLSNNGFWVFVGVCVVAATAKNIVMAILKHRERLAMIESGMRPGADSEAETKGEY
ncbi:MAG: hypothetical protein NXI32_09820 [bacterium]|nr:hypothetical protein [bacterium]